MSSEDRSLNAGGMSIPQWMKNKITENRYDLNQNTFSPPENDDSFLYIRYPQLSKTINTPLTASKFEESKLDISEVDYLNHKPPCKQSIFNPGYKISTNVTTSLEDKVKIKSTDTDNGLKKEDTTCGGSVIRVAHQMVSGKYPVETSIDDDPLKPMGFKPAQRRGSRSLPASPQTSPKNKRKLGVTNKYFTGPFVDTENHTGGWILQGLLSKREFSQSIGLISEECVHKNDLEKSISDLHLNEHRKMEHDIKKEFKTKPSEFREMNFWSPTSM
ncbi:hypothetical protein FQA39_LY18318 [Lamprigera yunnana]|nr:hypothetical protein FQA39_LY18318 [Lamprigera yunnana]